jgi:hypothetical protein
MGEIKTVLRNGVNGKAFARGAETSKRDVNSVLRTLIPCYVPETAPFNINCHALRSAAGSL